MIDSCFLDTTLLVEALLKARQRRKRAVDTIRGYKKSLLPVYAIKEMSAGALTTAVWLYNKLSETHSLAQTHEAMAANIRKPNKVSTSLELLQAANEGLVAADLSDARAFAKLDRMHADMLALSLRRIIQKAWRERRKITTDVVQELPCFPDSGPYVDEELKIMKSPQASCPPRTDCSYAPDLRKRPTELVRLLEAIEGSDRAEDVRRRAALHALKNTPKRQFDTNMCRKLGDGYFALNCPDDATILTSNVKDHKPLAEALGKTVTEYRWKVS